MLCAHGGGEQSRKQVPEPDMLEKPQPSLGRGLEEDLERFDKSNGEQERVCMRAGAQNPKSPGFEGAVGDSIDSRHHYHKPVLAH